MKTIQNEDHCSVIVSDDGTFRFSVRFDGCVHIEQWCNGYTYEQAELKEASEERDYLHICHLSGFIEKLQEIEKFAKERYPEYYGNK